MRHDFAENLIKGRIAETVFELMFREATHFDVYPLGYEHSIPILRQVRDHLPDQTLETIKRVIENVSTTPDFLLMLPDKTQVYLGRVDEFQISLTKSIGFRKRAISINSR
jgi:hypothetical protein